MRGRQRIIAALGHSSLVSLPALLLDDDKCPCAKRQTWPLMMSDCSSFCREVSSRAVDTSARLMHDHKQACLALTLALALTLDHQLTLTCLRRIGRAATPGATGLGRERWSSWTASLGRTRGTSCSRPRRRCRHDSPIL